MRHRWFGLVIAARVAGAPAVGGTWSLMTPATPPAAPDACPAPEGASRRTS